MNMICIISIIYLDRRPFCDGHNILVLKVKRQALHREVVSLTVHITLAKSGMLKEMNVWIAMIWGYVIFIQNLSKILKGVMNHVNMFQKKKEIGFARASVINLSSGAATQIKECRLFVCGKTTNCKFLIYPGSHISFVLV